jgi:Family of unknown function (DUF5681)
MAQSLAESRPALSPPGSRRGSRPDPPERPLAGAPCHACQRATPITRRGQFLDKVVKGAAPPKPKLTGEAARAELLRLRDESWRRLYDRRAAKRKRHPPNGRLCREALKMDEKPKRKGQFVKGTSGNPGGRPKVEGHVREIARQCTADAMLTLKSIMLDKHAPHAARITAANSILDRGYGRPGQALSLELQRRSLRELSDDELMAIASGDVIEGVAIESELQ